MRTYRRLRIVIKIWTAWFLKILRNCQLYVISLMIISLKIMKKMIYHIASVYYFLKIRKKI